MTDNNFFFPLFAELNIYHAALLFIIFYNTMYSTLMFLTVWRMCDIYEIETEICFFGVSNWGIGFRIISLAVNEASFFLEKFKTLRCFKLKGISRIIVAV